MFGKSQLGNHGQMTEPSLDTQAEYYIEYHATLYSDQGDKGLKGFYGRTCKS